MAYLYAIYMLYIDGYPSQLKSIFPKRTHSTFCHFEKKSWEGAVSARFPLKNHFRCRFLRRKSALLKNMVKSLLLCTFNSISAKNGMSAFWKNAPQLIKSSYRSKRTASRIRSIIIVTSGAYVYNLDSEGDLVLFFCR